MTRSGGYPAHWGKPPMMQVGPCAVAAAATASPPRSARALRPFAPRPFPASAASPCAGLQLLPPLSPFSSSSASCASFASSAPAPPAPPPPAPPLPPAPVPAPPVPTHHMQKVSLQQGSPAAGICKTLKLTAFRSSAEQGPARAAGRLRHGELNVGRLDRDTHGKTHCLSLSFHRLASPFTAVLLQAKDGTLPEARGEPPVLPALSTATSGRPAVAVGTWNVEQVQLFLSATVGLRPHVLSRFDDEAVDGIALLELAGLCGDAGSWPWAASELKSTLGLEQLGELLRFRHHVRQLR